MRLVQGPITNVTEVFNIVYDEFNVKSVEEEVDVFGYKKVENRVKPVATTLPEEFRINRKFPSNPLESLPKVPTKAPPFEPGERYTQERRDVNPVNNEEFLTTDEKEIIHWMMKTHEMAFAWDESEKGVFSTEYFEPVVIPTIEHIPWVLKNIPIPRGIYEKVVDIIKHKIDSGTYEPSNSLYRGRWFVVPKKDPGFFRLVHDLQPLNAVTIKDAAVPPIVEPYAESFGGLATKSYHPWITNIFDFLQFGRWFGFLCVHLPFFQELMPYVVPKKVKQRHAAHYGISKRKIEPN